MFSPLLGYGTNYKRLCGRFRCCEKKVKKTKGLTVRRRDGGMQQLLKMLLLSVNGDGNWRRRRALRVTHRTRGSLIEWRGAIELLVVAVAPAAGPRLRATTVRVRGPPLRRLRDLTVAVIQTGLVGPQTLMLRRLIHPRAVNRIVPLVIGHRAFTGHRNVRRDRAFPIIRIR